MKKIIQILTAPVGVVSNRSLASKNSLVTTPTRALQIFLLLLLYYNSKSHNGFIENKGQIHDQNNLPNAEVKYLLNTSGMNIQLKANSFSYDTYTIEQIKSPAIPIAIGTAPLRENKSFDKLRTHSDYENIYHFHRVDIEFTGANPKPEIISEDPSENYFNYYTIGTGERGATQVRSFQKVTYKNLYPNIDLEFLANDGKFKYNFILHYGANINDIKWKYKGSENTSIKNKNIEITVDQGAFTESIPESYLKNTSGKTKPVLVNFFSTSSGAYCFNVADNVLIRQGEEIIIDPTPNIVWSTYFGGNGDEILLQPVTDLLGNVYISGWTSSTNAIATSGAHQVTFNGGNSDGTISKFSSSGVLKWSTYYGGNGNEQAANAVLDKFGNLFIAGPTTSTSSIATATVYQSTYGGGPSDGFLAKFDTTGIRQWCTYYGGSNHDDICGCSIDKTGNVFILGSTNSVNGISTSGAHQVSFGGGPWDIYLAKFDNSGIRLWGTYYGGSGDDGGDICVTDPKGNIYFTGYAGSTASITTTGSHQQGYGGLFDALIVKMNNNGVRQWATYYGGSGEDIGLWIYFDTLDVKNGLYLSGYSASVDSISTLGSYQPSNKGGKDAFLAKFDTAGVRQWGTYLGGQGIDYGMAIASDNSSNVYLCGITQSFSFIATPNALQTSHGGGMGDAFLTKFTKNGLIQWSTYYGGSFYELAYSMTVDKFGDLYLVGCTSSNGIATSGAHQTTFGGGPHDGLCVKFNQLVSTNIIEPKTEKNNLNIFPNPNNGSFILQSKEDLILNIINELGQIVKTVTLNYANEHQLIVSNLECGVYFLTNKQTGEAIQNKIVVIK